ncbi:hypothetical protein HPU229334_10625 [Helicobacter pullorum]|uniref:Uncharacterized protein n=1 Tax=Helicobacter pullorum TaxID=35818 RepID=A0A0N1MPQ2_9HELI|nr:DUF5408 family protein [Helicobacter pullorum]KPH55077.1 hypothetical protein HPU229334_10625 [Helicobacter pullorum]
MENLRKELKQQHKTSLKAIKIALICCVITILFAALSLWILLNQITATANLSKNQKNLEQKIMQLEQNQKMPTH